ncbi:MAG: acyltransferase family protein [Paenisporosarcina sp.]|nr:acyltransferase family protein [Paenisporosarcina sp.]
MTSRYDYMDWLRVFAIFSVVGIHVVAQLVANMNIGMQIWWFANLVDSALRNSVPLFFMMSGALLLTKKQEEPLIPFFKKRVSKVAIPLLAWSIFYIVYRQVMWFEEHTWKQMIKMVLTDSTFFHLWFLYVILGLYLMTPFLRQIVKASSQQYLQYFLGAWFVISSLFPFVPKFFDFSLSLSAGLFTTYIGYFVLGAYLILYPIKRKWLPLLGILAAVGYFITAYGTYLLTMKNEGRLDGFFYMYISPNTIIIAIFLFVLFQQSTKLFKPNRFIQIISVTSLGIYLVHPIIQLYGRRIKFDEYWVHPVIAVPLVWIAIFFVSFVIVWILQKIPVVKKLVP